jgi:DnaJ-domain-containing protein 1
VAQQPKTKLLPSPPDNQWNKETHRNQNKRSYRKCPGMMLLKDSLLQKQYHLQPSGFFHQQHNSLTQILSFWQSKRINLEPAQQ